MSLHTSVTTLFEAIRADTSIEFWDYRKFRDERKVEWFDLVRTQPQNLVQQEQNGIDVGSQLSNMFGNPYSTYTYYPVQDPTFEESICKKPLIASLIDKVQELYGKDRSELKLFSNGAFVDTGGGGFGFSHILLYYPSLFVLAIMEYGEW